MPSKWLRDHRQQDLRDHKKRIDNMKSSIDTSTPREMPMSQRNLIERERKRVLVEKDNRLLLDRLAIAMSSKNIDNTLVPKPFVSLMELQRKKQLKKIMIQNSRLLERIQCTVPSYDHVVWEKDAEHHVGILRNMTEFPDLFVAPGCHKKGYDMVLVDAERAQQKALQQSGGQAGQSAVLRGSSASPHKGRPSHGKQQQQKSPSGPGGEDSPISQKSQNSAFVPYSYFPEEQYAQYQMQLQLQQQQQQLQLQQQQAQLEGDGQLYGTAVPFANSLTPEQQYAHQQQMFLYHQQQQQKLSYNNTNANFGPPNPIPINTSSTANPNVPYYAQGPAVANNNPYYAQQMQYNNHNTNTSNTITNPNTNTNISPAMGVQLPNIYQLPPGHMGSSQPY